jgi:predicted  nucleic acid-binding Zn-ribbon protein
MTNQDTERTYLNNLVQYFNSRDQVIVRVIIDNYLNGNISASQVIQAFSEIDASVITRSAQNSGTIPTAFTEAIAALTTPSNLQFQILESSVAETDILVAALEDDIVALQTQMDTANTNIIALQSQSGSGSSTAITALETQMATANTNIGALQTGLTTASTNIGTLASDIGDSGFSGVTSLIGFSSISSALGNIANSATIIGSTPSSPASLLSILGTTSISGSSISSVLATTKANVLTLQTDMTTANTNIGTLASDIGDSGFSGVTSLIGFPSISSALGNIAGCATIIGGLPSSPVSLRSILGTTSITGSSISSVLATTKASVSTLQSQMITANTNIGTLQSQMSTANSNIGTLQDQMNTANSNIGILQEHTNTDKSALIVDNDSKTIESISSILGSTYIGGLESGFDGIPENRGISDAIGPIGDNKDIIGARNAESIANILGNNNVGVSSISLAIVDILTCAKRSRDFNSYQECLGESFIAIWDKLG